MWPSGGDINRAFWWAVCLVLAVGMAVGAISLTIISWVATHLRVSIVGLLVCCSVANADDFTRIFEARPTAPAVPEAASEVDPASFLDRIVRIRSNQGGKSSGVNLKQGVLTCWHCVDDGPRVVVECGGETAEARLIYKDEKNDLALLAVKWKKPHPVVDLASDAAFVGQKVTSLGRGADGNLTVERHSVINIINNATWYGVDNPFVHGRSGSPLLNTDGKLVGIAYAIDIDREPYTGMVVSPGPIGKLVGSVPKPFRAIMWSPTWCGVCIANDQSLSVAGHPAVQYELRKGDEKSFPKEVTAYAAQAGRWPIWQIECERGEWCFAHSGRTFDDLIAIHNSGPNKPLPPSTWGK